MNHTRAPLLVLLALCSAVPAWSQQAARTPADTSGTATGSAAGGGGSSAASERRLWDAIAISAGYSWNSTTQWGIIQNRRVSVFDARLESEIRATPNLSIVQTVEFPLMVVARTSDQVTWACWPHYPSSPCIRDSSSTREVGIGIVPVGLRMYVGPRSGTRMFVHGAGGIMAFSGNVPVSDARRFNFTAQAGFGLEFPMPGRGLTVGYKFVHLSNGDTAPLNPGLDANVFYVGIVRR